MEKPAADTPRRGSVVGSTHDDGDSDLVVNALDRVMCRHSQAATPTHPDPGPNPDGGFDAWMVVFSAALVTTCLFGFVTSFGQLQLYYLTHQLAGYSKSTVAWISTIQGSLVFTPSIISGRVFDAHGARKLVMAGSVLSIGALVGVAFSHKYYQFLLAHALFGIASSILWAPATAVSGHWFTKHRSTAIGIIVCGTGLGSVIYPILLVHLFEKFSFRNSILIIAALNTGLLAPSWVFLKARHPPRAPAPWRKLKEPWKEFKYAFLALGSSMFMMNWMSPMFNAPVVAAANHIPHNIAEYAIAILSSGSFIGRPFAGLMADKLGVWNVFGTISFITSICLFAFWVAPMNTPATIVGWFSYGWLSGAWVTLVAAVVASISPAHEIGMRVGMVWSCCGPTLLVGPVICGVLVQAGNNTFKYAGIFCGCTFLIGSIMEVAPRMYEFVRGRVGQSKEVDSSAA
ncbi:Aspyridones efflux protein apdF [Vanrija pseudolonga]|uniref:Aspyridones efflux protein apdF n=1 Tax=Vanrija pseudolonga TaxID=143232 RepID=A0AAF0YAJ5_9TREE|nr:Aspyridones efflux protein apdF [Vanrija pseudolonga]